MAKRVAERRGRVLQRDHPDLGEVRLQRYDDGLVIEPAAPYPGGFASLTIRDDCGTAYQIWGDYGDGTKFVPAIPPEERGLSFLERQVPSGSSYAARSG